jgi:hypothetical protein
LSKPSGTGAAVPIVSDSDAAAMINSLLPLTDIFNFQSYKNSWFNLDSFWLMAL